MIDKSSEEQLKNSIDIVDIISNYIEIKKAGSNFKANCPFHGEKTPSFVISPSKQIFHCFGCGIGGDAIKFVMEYEKLSYPEALEKIASIINFKLDYTKGENSYIQLRDILEILQNWYRQNLNLNNNAKNYLLKRGINQNSIEKFGIGYVGNSQDVIRFLKENQLPLSKAFEAGVLGKKEDNSNFYARLIQRVTFPIYSASGAIVGFGGRTITNHPAKYINSPQTKLFNKSSLLYGYNLAKSSIYKKKNIIICEGYLDVIMFHQAGFDNSVATLGTALTTEHLPLLRRGEPTITLAYDGDNAGVNAGLKASIMLSRAGFDGNIVLFPNGADPADMIAEHKIDEVTKLLKNGQSFIPFVIEMITRKYDLNNPKDKERAFYKIKEYLNTLSPIIRDEYISYSANLLNIKSTLFNDISSQKEEKRYNYKNKKKRRVQIKVGSKDDIAKLTILKTLMENRDLIDMVIKVAEPFMFGEYADVYRDIITEKFQETKLIELSLDDSIKVLNQKELESAIIGILFKFYSNKLKEIINSRDIPIAKKSFLIRQIKINILPKLKKGILVPYNLK